MKEQRIVVIRVVTCLLVFAFFPLSSSFAAFKLGDLGKVVTDVVSEQKGHNKLQEEHNKLQEDHKKLSQNHIKLTEDHDELTKTYKKLSVDHKKLAIQKDHQIDSLTDASIQKDRQIDSLTDTVVQKDKEVEKQTRQIKKKNEQLARKEESKVSQHTEQNRIYRVAEEKRESQRLAEEEGRIRLVTKKVEDLKKVEDFKIKGLYLGMDIKEAHKIFKKKGFQSVGEVRKNEWSDSGGLTFGVWAKGWSIEFTPVYADKNGEVYKISLRTAIVDKLFNVEGIDVNTYALAFMDSYGIPEMPSLQDGRVGWQYTSPVGFKIIMFTDKETVIERVSASSGFKFD